MRAVAAKSPERIQEIFKWINLEQIRERVAAAKKFSEHILRIFESKSVVVARLIKTSLVSSRSTASKPKVIKVFIEIMTKVELPPISSFWVVKVARSRKVVAGALLRPASGPGPSPATQPVSAVPVVDPPLAVIHQHLVRLGHLLEPPGGLFRIVRIFIRMPPPGQLFVGFFDLLRGGRFPNAQN